MITAFGSYSNFLLLTDGDSAVVIDTELNMVENAGTLSALSGIMPWDDVELPVSRSHVDLATAALTDLDIKTVVASGRMYTIPKAVQEEAKRGLEWRKEEGRGGTPVGLNTARTLAKGGQIGIQKVRHIAKYFPRHEVDKKGKGYKPGQDGFPSNGRIAWALWGGDAGWRWAKAIVERENKKAVTAGGEYSLYDSAKSIYALPEMYDADVEAFRTAKEMSGDFIPEFVGRSRMDGTGFDRLYKVDPDGMVYVWDGSGWDDLGHVESDILTLDRALDDPYDTVAKRHCLLDPDAAMIISAHQQDNPFKPVSIYDIDEDEAETVLRLVADVDWDFVSDTMTAAGPTTVTDRDGNYTPEERSAKASSQVRDKSGKFAKAGNRVVVGGDSRNGRGTITGVNNADGTATVKLDNGNEVTVKGDLLEDEAQAPVVPEGYSGSPLDLSGIIGEPRPPIDRPNAYLPGGLPALTPRALRQVIDDWPAWVMAQRRAPGKNKPRKYKGGAEGPKTPGDNAKRTKKSDYLKGLEKNTGKKLWTAPATTHPLLQDFFNKPGNSLYYQPITSATTPKTVDEAVSKVASRNDPGTPLNPETSDVEPIYMAIVSPDDPRAVFDLISLVPASTTSTAPAIYKRVDGKWELDEAILRDLKSPTPPPVVPLVGEELIEVLSQVDGSQADQSVTAAGGLDRNRGNAEKLRHYWLFGRGALKIRWNTPGDWTRCYRNLAKYMGPRAKGYCSLRHKEATGVWPGSKFNVGKKSLSRAIRGTAVDVFDVREEDEIIDVLAMRARVEDARARVLMAGGGYGDSSASRGSKFMIPIVIPEGVETGDGRKFRKGSITMRPLPLPLLWQIKTAQGHDGSVVVGRIDRMERTDDGIGNAYGEFDAGPYGREAERLVRERFLRGVSADLDLFEAMAEDDDELDESLKAKKMGGDKTDVTKARVMAVTIVPKPAFKECEILIVDDTDDATEETGTEMIPDGVYVDNVAELDAAALVACGVVAGAIPVVPPAKWLANPKLSAATPLTVDDNGRVYGHIATWMQDHIGMTAGTRPPRSKSNYAYFQTGTLRADDGKDYPVGQLTLAGGHAPLEASAHEAVRHYDDTASAVADVRAGEDAYGIWVAGALRPGVTPEQIRALRASAPSGDWRPIRGSLELVAVCQVNVPGFPIARARVASGQVYALVAAGAATLARMKSDPITELTKRVAALEAEKAANAGDQTLKVDAELSAKAQAAKARMLSAKVKVANEALAAKRASDDLAARAAELSSRVKSLSNSSDVDIAAKARELSERVSGVIASVEAANSETDELVTLGYMSEKSRQKLAKEGKALPDGSYPISTVSDLKNAIQAYGRSKPSKRAAVRRHIMKRARSLKRADLIPDKWTD